MTDIMTPALGESVTEATVARWTKKAGDPVEIMTDGASIGGYPFRARIRLPSSTSAAISLR